MLDWYLIRTKPRQERRAIEHLHNQGFIVYCPWLVCKQLSNKVTTEPLFPGYVFLQSGNEASAIYAKVRSTRGVLRFVTFGKKLATVTESLIEIIKNQELSMGEYKKYKPGQMVELRDGPFKDLQAVYLCEKGLDRCVILLNMINQQQQIVISHSQLKKVS